MDSKNEIDISELKEDFEAFIDSEAFRSLEAEMSERIGEYKDEILDKINSDNEPAKICIHNAEKKGEITGIQYVLNIIRERSKGD